jgi:hypothetical protein
VNPLAPPQANLETLRVQISDLQSALAKQQELSGGLQRQVLDLGLAVKRAEAEKKLALERSVDERFKT